MQGITTAETKCKRSASAINITGAQYLKHLEREKEYCKIYYITYASQKVFPTTITLPRET